MLAGHNLPTSSLILLIDEIIYQNRNNIIWKSKLEFVNYLIQTVPLMTKNSVPTKNVRFAYGLELSNFLHPFLRINQAQEEIYKGIKSSLKNRSIH